MHRECAVYGNPESVTPSVMPTCTLWKAAETVFDSICLSRSDADNPSHRRVCGPCGFHAFFSVKYGLEFQDEPVMTAYLSMAWFSARSLNIAAISDCKTVDEMAHNFMETWTSK